MTHYFVLELGVGHPWLFTEATVEHVEFACGQNCFCTLFFCHCVAIPLFGVRNHTLLHWMMEYAGGN